MKIWHDACTGKHVRYGVAIAERMRRNGHEVIITSRQHPDTLALAKSLNEKVIVIGEYNPNSLLSRLKQNLNRQLEFCQLFQENLPDVAISHGSVDICRVAFGLGIPSISTFDTPHAEAVKRLTLPLVDFVVVSKAIPKHILKAYSFKNIYWFSGVDEVAWVAKKRIKRDYDYKRPLIVVRELETNAAYAKGKSNFTETLAKKLSTLGTVVFLSRFREKSIEEVINPKGFIDSARLVSQADLVVGVGGTIAREAALQGVPAIVIDLFTQQYVNDYLSKKGFPLFRVKSDRVINISRRLLGKKWDVKNLLEELENPVDVIEKIVEKDIHQ